MARINSKTLFLTTSPRTPEKIIPEIDLLIRHFEGKKWDSGTQRDYMKHLCEEDFFFGKGINDPAFSARDRINRTPKALGFVKLSPVIELTSAGEALLQSKRKEEVFLRQMLKFQLPSPYHTIGQNAANFWIKPYLEILRLIRTLGTLSFDELQIFGMQLTDWHDFEDIVSKINKYRLDKLQAKNYKIFRNEYLKNELLIIHSDKISKGEIKTRESNDNSIDKYIRTQSSNMRDYADACFRYLRATGLVNVSHIGKSLSIISERIEDVDYILNNIDRDPCFVDDEKGYVDYLGNSSLPSLYLDNKETIISRLNKEFPKYHIDIKLNMTELKNCLFDLIDDRQKTIIEKQVKDIKDYKQFDDIQNVYNQILNNKYYDSPLIFEWNTWRAMTMLDGGSIKANLKFDTFGKPLSTAQGNMADIVCDYGDFYLNVEVTLSTGQKQYEMESEPISRHLGKLKKEKNKPCYCLFVAPQINEACIAHFYALHNISVSYYGGVSTIVPLPLEVFRKMITDSYNSHYTPDSKKVQELFQLSNRLSNTCKDENEWYNSIIQYASTWLSH